MDPAQPTRSPLQWYQDFEPADISDPGVAVQLDALCEACLRVGPWLQDNYGVDRYSTQNLNHCRTGQDLETAYKDGCHLCTLLWHSLVEPSSVMYHQDRLERRNILLSHVRGGSEVKLRYVTAYSPSPFIMVGIELAGGDSLYGEDLPLRVGPPLPLNSPVRQFSRLVSPSIKGVSTSTCSESGLGQARTWLEECTQTHPGCRRQPSHIFPRRLLAVSRQSDGIHLQLKHSNELQDPSSCKWVCLSYCWGGASTLKLTRSTSSILQHGIMADPLPKTIRDAASVVLELGLEFLWVDALCILQDSPEDWLHEAESMGDIYRGSFLTLSALGARDSSVGLFAKRDPLIYSKCRIPVKDQVATIYPNWSGGRCRTDGPPSPWPLYTRGWVVQERILARRTLRFGPTLSWECWQSAAFELDPNEYGVRGDEPQPLCSSFYQHVIEPGRSRALPEDKQGQLLRLWDTIVFEFSKANLTVPSDREAALLGLVSAIALRTGWQYMAGYWLPLTVRHLLWRPADNKTEARRTGLSPSWSWLSVTGGLGFHFSDSTQVEHLAEIGVVNDEDVTTVNSAEGTCRAVPVRLSCLRIRSRPLRDGGLKPLEGWPFGPIMPKWDVSDSFQDEVSILPLAVNRPYREMYAILVSPSKLYPGAYERVGFLALGGWSESHGPASFYEMMLDASLREKVILV